MLYLKTFTYSQYLTTHLLNLAEIVDRLDFGNPNYKSLNVPHWLILTQSLELKLLDYNLTAYLVQLKLAVLPLTLAYIPGTRSPGSQPLSKLHVKI